MNTIQCKPLGQVREEQALQDVAGLIYDTDPYIYPAMFTSRKQAIEVIPKMISVGDTMFCSENIYIAEIRGRICGIILWHRGPLLWNPDVYRQCGGSSEYIDEVCRRYFSTYSSISRSTVSIINVCTSEHGKGIGTKMLHSFMKREPGPYELYVLADNAHAIKLYSTVGFSVTETLQGFSLDNRGLPCFKMENYS